MNSAKSTASKTARSVQQHPAMRALITIGLIAYGIVHLVVGWIALQVAWGGDNQQADQQGALRELAQTPVGTPLLWVLAVGLFALALWQLTQAVWGQTDEDDDKKRALGRARSAAKTVVYVALGVAAIRVAVGSGSASGNAKSQGMTARLMSAPMGRVLVIAVGLVIIGVGVSAIVKGVKKSFTKDLGQSVPEPVLRFGQLGYIAKGAAIGVVGGLFVWAGLSYDPAKAGGLDEALRTVATAPVGPYLLTAMAIGFICFGIYCFFWARNPRR